MADGRTIILLHLPDGTSTQVIAVEPIADIMRRIQSGPFFLHITAVARVPGMPVGDMVINTRYIIMIIPSTPIVRDPPPAQGPSPGENVVLDEETALETLKAIRDKPKVVN